MGLEEGWVGMLNLSGIKCISFLNPEQQPPLTQGPPFSTLAYPARHDFHFLEDFFQAYFKIFFFSLTTSVSNEYANIMVHLGWGLNPNYSNDISGDIIKMYAFRYLTHFQVGKDIFLLKIEKYQWMVTS